MAVAIDRREGAAIGVAVIGHVALFGLLSVGFLATPNPLKLESTPIEVSLTDEAGLVSEAPVIEKEAPAERLAEVPGPPELDSPPPVPVTQPEPVTKPDPTPPKAAPAPAPRPQPKAEAKKSNPAPAKALPKTERSAVKPTGRLTGITDGLTDQQSKGKATTPPGRADGARGPLLDLRADPSAGEAALARADRCRRQPARDDCRGAVEPRRIARRAAACRRTDRQDRQQPAPAGVARGARARRDPARRAL
ncbi:hypothetical protein [Sphingomonas sp. J315]|uniref:hypothetical protein n=1 Tax=Sphingomonas sp. J315 TaxID=2898433 RepID=UPI0021AE1420|nr:hypothetical protein [Sphingomonas sp. J315]UUY00215.1 hypothetical protein LRS08_03565 [Sphingomonas sp. J315]